MTFTRSPPTNIAAGRWRWNTVTACATGLRGSYPSASIRMSVSSLTRRASASGVKAFSGHSASIIGMVLLLHRVLGCNDDRTLRGCGEVAVSPLFEEYQTVAHA